ncbi:MAG: S41 family peptidase [Clostridiales bacterium]|nr:S41 family peptidase [Clostridiales bacterium]
MPDKIDIRGGRGYAEGESPADGGLDGMTGDPQASGDAEGESPADGAPGGEGAEMPASGGESSESGSLPQQEPLPSPPQEQLPQGPLNLLESQGPQPLLPPLPPAQPDPPPPPQPFALRRLAAPMALTALLTALAVVALLRFFGALSFSDAVFFAGGAHSPASVSKLQEVWDYISLDYYEQPDEDRMLESAAAAVAASVGDPYTVYYTKEEMQSFNERSAGAFYGIGVSVAPAPSGRLAVVEVADGSPAQEAGVLPGDEIVSVDGRGVEEIGDEQTVVALIKGEKGAHVRVGFYRPADDAVLEFDMSRYEVRTQNIASKILDGGIGYIRIAMFDNSAGQYFGENLSGLLEGGIGGLIIDLRDNPGGSYDGTVEITDRLIGEGVIVYTEDRNGEREYRRSGAGSLDMPLALLINSNSASASEIMAGAVKAHGAGALVGQRTFGKGLVQSVVTLEDGSGLKYTRSRYFTPDGVCIQGEGIEPDIAVPLPDDYAGMAADDIPEGGDAQLRAAIDEVAMKMKMKAEASASANANASASANAS